MDARKLFDDMTERDLLSWNMIIRAYGRHEFPQEALVLFYQMQRTGVQPDHFTFASILPVCAKLGALEQGFQIHQRVTRSGFGLDFVVHSALMDMYAKCGSMQKALELFDRMPQRDVVSWTAIIAGYAQNGLAEKALEAYQQMQQRGVQPDQFTFASILPACAKMGALEHGMNIHQSIRESGHLSNCIVQSALIDMYAKCGSIKKARKLFDTMHRRDVVSWTAMIAGYAMHGYCKDALKLFQLMMHSGTQPNHASFVCVLFACSHVGLLDEGCKLFNCMSDSYCIMPKMDHYVCMVDLLGRAGYLEEAFNFIIKMPIKLDTVVWISLLGSCRLHKDIGLGEFTASLLFETYPVNTAAYNLMSKVYAEVGRWGDFQKVRRLMKDRGIKKMPGCSWIEVDKRVHVFLARDRSHPQTQKIYAKLEELSLEMKAAGYMTDSRYAQNDVEVEDKDIFIDHHSEKLAIAFGLLNTSPETTIRVVKNLRVCADCHTATKFISRIVAREIVVRDANRFHHFKSGHCSCRDYW
ncbi:pentatricopeptide repeat-containing protein At1g08070, chloroplastic-like [Cryptomeria japonica]|uniref:pentatricopeptide repeat-containing protein At1g08070, chloroplastic-like n=1 Tax=Cryptomeria japonica TaxID=3369 RepID=UPI0027DA8553|nr:pentatricopeptide repeat-containing protein At1g08070, chloroplastic-like [Cryptomeria japonica]XP_057866536.2 pentatricopeptide repeat-containing protein At1g08070, chloroplastic-like [Cryptomeria japonica]